MIKEDNKIELELISYYTMNSWNLSKAPAYNLKIYNVIPKHLRDKAYELLSADEYAMEINDLIYDFDREHNQVWQAGFNGRSGGYLVLYQGGRRPDGVVYTYPGRGIEAEDVPDEVLKAFETLAMNIVDATISMCEDYIVEEEIIYVPQKIKVLKGA